MTRLITIFIITFACLSAQTANPVAAEERWEYCVVEPSTLGVNNETYVGKAKICYATDQGCKEETITVSEPNRQRQYNHWDAVAVADRAVAKALAQLGKDRWELVTVMQPHPREGDGLRYPKALYFKRRAR